MTHTSTEPEARDLAYWIAHTTDNPTAALIQSLHARVQELEKAESDLIAERDRRDEIIDRMADAVLGTDRHEWSSVYDLEDAAQEVEDKMAAQAQRVPLPLSEILHFAGEQGFVRVQGTRAFHVFIDGTDIAGELEAMARDIERAYGITQEKQG